MKPGFWHERWRRNEIGFHQREINAHLQRYWPRLELSPEAPVFVPLCGKSRDLLWLRAQGHPVLGVEISPIAVAGFFTDNDLQPTITVQGRFRRHQVDGLTLLEGDFFDLSVADLTGVAGVYDRASLVAMPPQMRPDYARHLAHILPPGSRMLLVTMEYPQEQMQGPPFCVGEPEVLTLFGDGFSVTPLERIDILEENPRFRQKGLSALAEQVYLLQRQETQ